MSAHPASERQSRADLVEWLTFLSDPTTGIIKVTALPSAATEIPAGTKMLFVQTAAPTGWTKDVTHNNKALRIVNGTAGTGGTATFTDVFTAKSITGSTDSTTAAGTVGGTALTEANLPAHTHTVTATGSTSVDGSHTHTIDFTYSLIATGSIAGGYSGVVGGSRSTSADGSHQHTVAVNGSTSSIGSNSTHTHTFTGTGHTHTLTGASVDLAVAYVDVIIATRNA
jgi:hypothetical protein